MQATYSCGPIRISQPALINPILILQDFFLQREASPHEIKPVIAFVI